MNTRKVMFAGALGSMAIVVAAANVQAAPIGPVNVSLSGNTQYDGWNDLGITGNPGFPGFPGTGAWPSPIGSQLGGDATLNKTANGNGGGPYPAGGSIYFGGFSGDVNNPGGTLVVTDLTPVANLANVVFQVQIGEAWTYDFYNHELPVLSYNGGDQNLAADSNLLLEQFDNGTVTMPTGEETVYINTWLVQWDLSGISDPITDFSISFSGVQHAQLYALRLDQSDTVPEPASAGLLLIGAAAMLMRRRRRA